MPVKYTKISNPLKVYIPVNNCRLRYDILCPGSVHAVVEDEWLSFCGGEMVSELN